MHKDYLGDSVYAEIEDGMVKLTTENGYGPSNEIFLEPEVIAALNRYVERIKSIYAEQRQDAERPSSATGREREKRMKNTKTSKRKRPGRFAGARGSATVNVRLLNAVTALMDIVEGTRNVRWQHEGRRLVDTPQWCDLYCAWCAEKRKSPNDKITHSPANPKP